MSEVSISAPDAFTDSTTLNRGVADEANLVRETSSVATDPDAAQQTRPARRGRSPQGHRLSCGSELMNATGDADTEYLSDGITEGIVKQATSDKP